MGQSCKQMELPNKNDPDFVQFRKTIPNISMSEQESKLPLQQSRLLIRMSSVRLKQNVSSEYVKSRLSHLPDISRRGRSPSEQKKIYMPHLKAQYLGEIYNNQPNGLGSLNFQNGDYLEGEFVNGCCEGKGRFIKANGSYYEGDFKNNVADGYGKYIDSSGYKYQGQWKSNVPNGKGEAVYPDESKYNGCFLNNRKHGKGVLMQKGCIFEGNFVDNKLEGVGSMQSDNGQSYFGEWHENQKHGQGEYTWPNGSKYKGEYRFDLRQGQGIMTYANGQYYQGSWVKGMKEGKGVYFCGGKKISGNWSKGDLVQQFKR